MIRNSAAGSGRQWGHPLGRSGCIRDGYDVSGLRAARALAHCVPPPLPSPLCMLHYSRHCRVSRAAGQGGVLQLGRRSAWLESCIQTSPRYSPGSLEATRSRMPGPFERAILSPPRAEKDSVQYKCEEGASRCARRVCRARLRARESRLQLRCLRSQQRRVLRVHLRLGRRV